MKAITIYQPWASLIAAGAKTIETRSWPTHYRGPLAIHAGKTTPAWAFDAVRTDEALRDVMQRHLGTTNLAALPTGVIVATCELVDCREMISGLHGRYMAFDGPRPMPVLSWDEIACGDYAYDGRFAWMLDNIKPLSEPVPATGKQMLWEWTPPAGFEAAAVQFGRDSED